MTHRRYDSFPLLQRVGMHGSEVWTMYARGVLEGGYNQSFRAYHNLNHITTMMANCPLDASQELRWAILFHDVVYSLRAKSPENESQSADVAMETLSRVAPTSLNVAHVQQCIMATTHTSRLPDTATDDERIIADLDLRTMELPYEAYMAVQQKVKQEYLSVFTLDEWDAGRRKFLEFMLAKPKIAYTPHLNEDAVRANLERELATL